MAWTQNVFRTSVLLSLVGGLLVVTGPVADAAPAASPTAALPAARLPQLTVDPAAGRRVGAGGTGSLQFTVRLLRPANTTVTVAYATSDGTALAGRDYAATSGTATLPLGVTAVQVVVPVVLTSALGANRTMTLSLSHPAAARIERATATGTLLADRVTSPQVSIGDAAAYRLWGQPNTMSFPVTLSQPAATDVSVHWSTKAHTAHAGSDFVAASGTLTVPAGARSRSVVVVLPSQWNRTGANFTVVLTAPTGAVPGTMTGTGSLLPGVEPDVAISADAVAAVTGATATTSQVAVHLTGGTAREPITVAYRTQDGTAHAGTDYTAARGSVTIPVGDASATIPLSFAASSATTGETSFSVQLLRTSVGVLLVSSVTVTLEHDAAAAAHWVTTGPDVTVPIGDTYFIRATVGVTSASETPTPIDVRTVAGTATSPRDYDAVQTTVQVSGASAAGTGVTAIPRVPGVITFEFVFEPQLPAVLAPGDDGVVTVRLDPLDTFAVYGRVVDATGAGIGHAEFQAGPVAGYQDSVRANGAGRFVYPGALPGQYISLVTALSTAYPTPAITRFGVVDRPVEVEVLLISRTDVVVNVVGADAQPLAGATVVRSGGTLPTVQFVTGDDGQAVLATDGTDRVTVSVSDDGLTALPNSPHLEDPGDHDFFVLARAPFIVGYTLLYRPGCPKSSSPGRPANGCNDFVPTPGATVSGGGRTTTSSSYLFVLEQVALGTYSISGTIPGGLPTQSRAPITVDSATQGFSLAVLCFVPPDTQPGSSGVAPQGLPRPTTSLCRH